MSESNAQIQFEQSGTELTAVCITREQRSPVIASLQRALFALGIVVSTYQARPLAGRLMERVVLSRSDGSAIDGSLIDATKAVILPIALG